MPSHPRVLTGLPADVLLEILAHLLVDTPKTRRRAAVVRTCSLLHQLGLPLLYRVVDLTGIKKEKKLLAAYECLFAERGLLTFHGRIKDLGLNVVELRWEGRRVLYEFNWTYLSVTKVQLPRCTKVLIEIAHQKEGPPLAPILVQLPIEQLSIRYISNFSPTSPTHGHRHGECCGTYTGARLNDVLDLQAQPWANLRTVSFYDTIWYDSLNTDDDLDFDSQLSLAEWSFRILVVDLKPVLDGNKRTIVDLFLDMAPVSPGTNLLPDVEKIELRVGHETEALFKKQMAERNKVGHQWTALQDRILPLIVFVDANGKETKLIKPE